MKSKKVIDVLSVSMAICALDFACASDLERPTANLTEKFVTSSGWTGEAPAGVVAGWATDECIQVSYPQRDPSAFLTEISGLAGTTNSSGGIFTGDFSKMDALSFDAKKKNLVNKPSFYFKSASGTKWITPLNEVQGMASGVWRTINLKFNFNEDPLICRSSPLGKTLDDYAVDLRNVVEIGFMTVRDGNGNINQEFCVDNLKLIGPWGTNLVDGVPIAWALEYGLTNDLSTVGRDDADGDGFTNASEFLAGTNPNNSNSFFRLDIGRNEQGKVVVKWADNKYMKFTLLESSNLVSFTAVQDESNIVGVGTQRVVEVNNADVTGVRFYKVQISQ